MASEAGGSQAAAHRSLDEALVIVARRVTSNIAHVLDRRQRMVSWSCAWTESRWVLIGAQPAPSPANIYGISEVQGLRRPSAGPDQQRWLSAVHRVPGARFNL